MERLFVNITTPDGTLLERISVLVDMPTEREPSPAVAAAKIVDIISNKFDTE